MGFFSRLAHGISSGWSAFMGRDPTNLGPGSSSPPYRTRYRRNSERSIIASVYTRISIDVASIDLRHVVLDEDDRYLYTKKSGLQECLSLRANIDQSGRAFIQSLTMNLLDEGTIAVLPFIFDGDIKQLRVAKIEEWYPYHVKVQAYNEKTGRHETTIVEKSRTAIIENPFYAVMNEQNSTAQRLIRKLNMLDKVDEQSSSGKFNLIIQLPYPVRSELQMRQAEKRIQAIEAQLIQSPHGIGYIDATEKVTQLNRALENNLLAQIEYYRKELYSQLGMTQEIFDGSADEQQTINYHNRAIEPILSAIADAFKWAFLSKTARTQGQSIKYYRDPFRLVTISSFAEIASSLKQIEVISTNELRSSLGFRPDDNPRSDQLVNPNINTVNDQSQTSEGEDQEDITDEEQPMDFSTQ